jgi:hypothetical protein
MGNNILNAVYNIFKYKNPDLKDYSTKSSIRINAVGDQLEFYIKDSISGSFDEKQDKKEELHKKVFSWLGSQNNPPDIIVKGGDAFEIKKIGSVGGSIQLNSSSPKDKLYSLDPKILPACKNCEKQKWIEKDIFYVVGSTIKNKLKYLFFIQGNCWSAKHKTYESLHSELKKGIEEVIDNRGLNKKNTKELAGIDKIDPKNITNLRVRAMWTIKNPIEVYKNICELGNKEFYLFSIMRKDKYISYPKEDREKIEKKEDINIRDIKIKDPNDISSEIDAKLISFSF